MIAAHLKPHHLGQKFRAKADGQKNALSGGLSDYAVYKNRSGVPLKVYVWINGGSAILRPDSTVTPIQGHDQRGQGQLL